MADESFDDRDFDDIFEELGFPTISSASAFTSSHFHRGEPFSGPADFGVGCPRRLGPTPFILDFAASAASTFSPPNLAAHFGIGAPALWPSHSTSRHSPTPRHHPARNLPILHFASPSLPGLRGPANAGPSSATAESPLRASRGPFPSLGRTTPAPREPNSDDFFLNELATGNFSSPSILNDNPRELSLSPWQRDPVGRPTDSQTNDGRANEAEVKNEPAPADDIEMPSRQTGGAAAAMRGSRRSSGPGSSPATSKKRKREKIEEDPFAEDTADVIDLAGTEEVPEELMAPKTPKSETKLSKFQCVVCMDDTSALTVTHCGHLYCGECLHSSLQIDASKKICPICRQKVEPRPPGGRFSAKAKGYYPLQLRLTSKKSLGKRAAQ